MRNIFGLMVLLSPFAVAAGCGDDSLPAISEPCPDCVQKNDAAVADAPQAILGDADTWKGARGTIKGTVANSPTPEFPWFPSEGLLKSAARIRFPYASYDYTTTSSAAGTFELKNIPIGKTIVMLEDIEGQNGILPTVMGAESHDGDTWALPGVSRTELEAIYLANNVELKPDRAQVILTLMASPVDGGGRIAGASIALGDRWEATIVDDAKGGFTKGATTGPLGTIIFANVTALPYPGETVQFSYSYQGRTGKDMSFAVVAGAVTRAPVLDASKPQ